MKLIVGWDICSKRTQKEHRASREMGKRGRGKRPDKNGETHPKDNGNLHIDSWLCPNGWGK